MKKTWSILPVFAGILLGLMSCYPGDVTNVQHLQLVVTSRDYTVSYSRFSTYVVLDSVVHIDLEDNANDSLLIRDSDALILARVATNMEAIGYLEEMDPLNNTPDVILLVGALAVTKSAYSSYGWWPWVGWGYSPGWGCCGPGYGWGYPWAPASTVSYAFGTLLITMMDPSRPSLGFDTAPVLWVAGINGLLEGSTSNIGTRITTSIDQAFDQSPYLSPLVATPNAPN